MADRGKMSGKPASSPLPDEVRRLCQSALQRQGSGDAKGAVELYLRALDQVPGIPDALNNLAVLLKATRQLPAGIAYLRRAILYAPQTARLYSNLGNLLWLALDFDASLAAFRRALELDPNRAETHHNLGLLQFSLGDPRAAIECYDRSLALVAGNRVVRWDRALALLASGDLPRGFAEYEVRLDLDDPTLNFDAKLKQVRSLPLPLWQGEDLAGRTLYVYAEQGFGDTVQFIRFLAPVLQRGARVIFDSPPELMRLLANFPGLAELRPQPSPLPAADFHSPLMSLPHRLGTTLATIPAAFPYIVPPPVTVGPSLRRPPGTRLAIGIAWAGRPQHNNDLNRSMGLEHFLGLCDLPGVALYSLQKGPRAEDIGRLGAQALVHDLGPRIQDFADTARLVQQLDLIVSVDTALAHLAGALARPAFVLLPYAPDWRWLTRRDDTPWYPSLRLFRQTSPADWKGVIERVRAGISAMLGRR